MKEARQVERALSIIAEYNGESPLHHYLRNFFRQHPEMGSRDRRLCSGLVYSWFRIGKALMQLSPEERLAHSVFLTQTDSNDVTEYLLKKFTKINHEYISADVNDKLDEVRKYNSLIIEDFFPFAEPLSDGINRHEYAKSMLLQPYTWIRANADASDKIQSMLAENNLVFIHEENRFGILSGVNLEQKGLHAEWFEVQDKSSQQTGTMYQPNKNESWYDCCAASGGKSLLLHSMESTVMLTVSDNRSAILKNLEDRFRKNKIKNYKMILADLELEPPDIAEKTFEGIIADVPCSGSGTWSRAPERLSFFNMEDLDSYIERQKKIIHHTVSLLKTGSPLIYSTCSVFKRENEVVVEYICNTYNFFCEKMEVFNGINSRADTMFAARLIRK